MQGEAAKVHEEVQEALQWGRQKEAAAVREDLLRARLLAKLAARGSPDGTPSRRPRVVLVRDRDRVYGNCLPKFPQPHKWRSSTRVRQAIRARHTSDMCEERSGEGEGGGGEGVPACRL